jgi:Glutaminase
MVSLEHPILPKKRIKTDRQILTKTLIIMSLGMLAGYDSFGAESSTLCFIRKLGELMGPQGNEFNALFFLSGDLRQIPKRSRAETQTLNDQLLDSLRTMPIHSAPGSRRNAGFTETEVTALFKDIQSNRQVEESLCGRYNGSDDQGFCFGRAAIAHFKAIRAGASNRNIRKVWAVGDLNSRGNKWQYHVTTIVRMESEEWYAIDPIFGQPMPLEKWCKSMKDKYDANGTMRLYSSPASQFSVGTVNSYSRGQFSNQDYRSFFADFMEQLSQESTGRPGPWGELTSENHRRIQQQALEKSQAPPDSVANKIRSWFGRSATP